MDSVSPKQGIFGDDFCKFLIMNKVNINYQQVSFFHKWVNRGYGVYNSIKRIVAIGVLPLSYNILAMPVSTFAQPDSISISKNVYIDEVVINAGRKASTYSEFTRVVRVISREELGAQQATSLQEILERVVLVDIRQRGGQGVQADINFRGGTFDQTLVLLNGINISDPQTGHHSLNIPFSLESIQRIEILHGPGAREFGLGAFAGAINIITEPDSFDEVHLSTFAGEHGLSKNSASSSLGAVQFRNFLAASYDRSDGYTANTDFKSGNLYLHSTLSSKAGLFSLFTGYQSKGFGANSFYTPKFPNQYEVTRVYLGGIHYGLDIRKAKVGLDGYYRRHFDRFELFRDNPASWYAGHSYHTTDVYGVKPSVQIITRVGKAVLGTEFRHEGILSNKLGDSLSKPIRVKGADDVFYTRGASRNLFSTFASSTVYLGDFILAGGVQLSNSSALGNTCTWGGDISYLLSANLRVFSSINKTYRIPTFNDLYYESETNVGNPDLKPELATTYEAGTKYNYCNFSVQAAGFYRDGKNLIDWVKGTSDVKWRTVNYTGSKTYGVDFSAYFSPNQLAPFVNDIGINYSFVNSQTNSRDMDSYYVLDYLKHNLIVTAGIRLCKNVMFKWNLRYQNRAGEYQDYSSGKTTGYPAIWLVDARLSYGVPKFLVFIDGSNLFNTSYVDIANVKQPGRWLGVGLNFRFDI